jgi:sec-independent protein translocase protein TatB
VFNIGGGELIAILIIALIVLGPDKLPDAVRRAGRLYGELRRMSSGFQAELRDVLDEPMREVRSTTDLVKDTFTTSVYDHDLEAQAAATTSEAPAVAPGEVTTRAVNTGEAKTGEAKTSEAKTSEATAREVTAREVTARQVQGDRPVPLPPPTGQPPASLPPPPGS